MLPLPSFGQCYYTVAFSPDGRWLAAGGSAGAVDVWDLHAPQEPARQFPPLGEPIVRAQFASAERVVVIGTSREFAANVVTAKRERTWWPALATRVSRAAVSPEADRTALIGEDGVYCWSLGTHPALEWVRRDTRGHPTDLALTVHNRLVVACAAPSDANGDLEVRNAGTGLVVETISIRCHPHRVACSPDGEFAAVLANGNLSAWNLPERRLVVDRRRATHGGWLSLAFAPHGRRIVTGGIDSMVGVWDAFAGGPPLTTFQWGVGPVYAVAFDRDGLRAAAAGHSGVLVWDVDE